MVRRPRDAPAEAALDRADVDDRLRAAVGVRRVVLPGRDPLEDGVEHLVHPEDRVLAPPPLAEGGVDEAPVDADPQPERAEVAEDDLRPRSARRAGTCRRRRRARRGIASRRRSRGTRRPTASPYCVFSISPQTAATARRRAAARRRPAAPGRPRRSRPARPSCSRSEPVEPSVPDERLGLEPRNALSHGSRPEYDVSVWPLNMRLSPPPAPAQVPSAFARPSSTCCHWHARPTPRRARPSARPSPVRGR